MSARVNEHEKSPKNKSNWTKASVQCAFKEFIVSLVQRHKEVHLELSSFIAKHAATFGLGTYCIVLYARICVM